MTARFLFDENLSHTLVGKLADIFPDSVHVNEVGLSMADDPQILRHAATRKLIAVTQDSDFQEQRC